jgi:hypothetical protein
MKDIPWDGQVFAVIHCNRNNEIDKYWDFHVNRLKDIVAGDQVEIRMDYHLRWVIKRWKNQLGEGGFSGEIHTEDSWNHKERDTQAKWHKEQVEARANG